MSLTFNLKSISIYIIVCSDNSLFYFGAPYIAKEKIKVESEHEMSKVEMSVSV